MSLKIGDHVAVNDEGLASLRAILTKYGMTPAVPNNTGFIDDIKEDMAYIIFDDSGQCAPYYLHECELLNG